MPEVAVFHMVDESLIKDTVRCGSLQKVTIRRLMGMIESAQMAGANAVMVTCSSLGEGVKVAQKLIEIPVIRVDEAMAEMAVKMGSKIGVLATLETTLEPTSALLREKAAKVGRRVELIECLCDEAFDAVLTGDTQTHDRIVAAALVEEMRDADVIVLAQASMARVLLAIPEGALRSPVLASPGIAVKRTRQILEALQGAAV